MHWDKLTTLVIVQEFISTLFNDFPDSYYCHCKTSSVCYLNGFQPGDQVKSVDSHNEQKS